MYDPIPIGERNTRLFKEASRLRKSGAALDTILTELFHIHKHACQTPLSDEEVHAIARNAIIHHMLKETT